MPGTPNPDFDAEPWCTDEPTAPDVIYVQDSTEPMRPANLSQPEA